MADISQITDQLWTGGAIEDEADVQQLVDLGITADLDLRQTNDTAVVGIERQNAGDHLLVHPEIEYCYNGTRDDGAPKPVSWFEASWDFAEPVLNGGGVLLAHCKDGHNRGPSTAAFILMAYYGMTESDSFALVVEKRPVATLRYLPDAVGAIIALGLLSSVLAGPMPGSKNLGEVRDPLQEKYGG